VKNLILLAAVLIGLPTGLAAQPLPKARVAELIKAVEDGVDDFRDYLEKRGDNARDRSKDSDNQSRRGRGGNSEANKDRAESSKDALDDALGDLNKSTNRLRRKFDATDKWMETKSEVQRVVDDGRAINAEVARGSYGTEVARLWAALRTGINDLARAYNVTPLGV
jgi:hypothetical protein